MDRMETWMEEKFLREELKEDYIDCFLNQDTKK
jgi:hypothetical protein